MKIIDRILPILLLVMILFTSCKKDKMDSSNISIYKNYYLLNNTQDTFIYINNTYDILKDTLYPDSELITYGNYRTNYYNTVINLCLYRISDTNNVYVQFSGNNSPYNYKLDYFEDNNWNKIKSLKEVQKVGNYEYYIFQEEITFTISTENIINLK